MPKAKQLAGQVFGRLTVQGRSGTKNGRAAWLCECQCGNTVEVVSHALTSGHTTSCGCWRDERNRSTPLAHGHSRRATKVSTTYKSWQNMLARCNNPNVRSFKDYGGRGITICAGWYCFENFLADMGERPAGMTLERIDNAGNYEPGNCRWASRSEQNRNTRTNSIVVFQGRRITQAEFAAEIGISQSTVSYRLRNGWTPEQVATTKPHPGNRLVASKLGDTVQIPSELIQ